MAEMWPHLQRGKTAAWEAEAQGFRSICITSPTGGGKRRLLTEMVRETEAQNKTSIVFTNRRIITKQTKGEFEDRGLDHGMIAAGYKAEMAQEINIASVQTMWRRRANINLPLADRIFIDEAHSTAFHWLIPEYLKRGAKIYLFTATPIGMSGVADKLIIAGTNSELRKLGALVTCTTYNAEMPGIKGIRRWKVGVSFSTKFNKWFHEYQTEVFANLFHWWKSANPFAMSTIVFAPGVAESRWLAAEWTRIGVPAAHIDGETSDEERAEIEGKSRENIIKIVSSVGVMREGADWGWLQYAMGVQPWIELGTYLQSIGRVLRAYPGKTEATFLDFAGAYWRHGSPNDDQQWTLEDTELSIARRRFEGFKNGSKPEPIRCPQCGMERKMGDKCPKCAHVSEKSVRMIRMGDGQLVKVQGPIALEKPKKKSSDQSEWTRTLYICGASGRTYRQASAIFKSKMGHWPPPDVTPKPDHGSLDWGRKVADVDRKFAKKGERR